MAEFIAESPRLLRLDLRENEIKTGGLMALSLALKVNHSLLRLDLDREPKKEAVSGLFPAGRGWAGDLLWAGHPEPEPGPLLCLQVKSFIETQKALLAEIQNGCKRNFVLAREREEKEQRLQLSASMPEITVTEPQPDDEPREEPAAEAQENGAPGSNPRPDSDSDSDSEGEDGDEADGERAEAPCPALVPPTDSLGPGDRSPPGCPSSPAEQRISVSSPGWGHKVFVVTRVESPPERAEPPVPPAPPATSAPPGPASPPASTSPPPSPFLTPTEAASTPDPGPPESQPPLEPPQVGPPLPNGLKPEFALALSPEPPPGPEAKVGSCGLEHGERRPGAGWRGPWVLCVTLGKHPPVGCLSYPLKKVDLDRDEWDWVLGPHHTPWGPWEPLGDGACQVC